MLKRIGIASALFTAVFSSVGSSAQTTPMRPVGPTAAQSIADCRKSVTAEPCSGNWRGLTFTLYADYSGSIVVANEDGTTAKWSVGCHTDRVEGYRDCVISQGSFRLFLMRGSYYFMGWGKSEKYPGSQMIAKIGSGPPLRFSGDKVVSGREAGAVMGLLRTNDHAIFRWYDWPYNSSNDIDVDSHRFTDVVHLLDAIDTAYGALDR